MGIIYRALVEVVDPNQRGKFIKVERTEYSEIDPTRPDTVSVTKIANAVQSGFANPTVNVVPGERFMLTIVNPAEDFPENSASMSDYCHRAGVAVVAAYFGQSTDNPEVGYWPYYD